MNFLLSHPFGECLTRPALVNGSWSLAYRQPGASVTANTFPSCAMTAMTCFSRTRPTLRR